MQNKSPLLLLLTVMICAWGQETIALPGLKAEVEVITDTWGVPHIYAKNTGDLFFAQGYLAARDRLYQLDLWRRLGTGKMAEVTGPSSVPRDRLARLIRFRGEWSQEWASYSADAKDIATAFTNGINAYIRSIQGKRTAEFTRAGYDPGFWVPEDVTARLAGLLMVHNVPREVTRALRVKAHGLRREAELFPPDPVIPLELPKGLDLNDITDLILRDYTAARRATGAGDGELDDLESTGSNNWVVDGTRTASRKPLLASDPHRPLLVPSLRKTWHLVAPGWNVFGAGEPALPGVALGHNEHMGFSFTIVGIDQADLYVEQIHPENLTKYKYRNEWKDFEIEIDKIAVKGQPPVSVELKYTIHGPVVFEDVTRRRAYALKWVGAEPGGAGYLPALRLARARNWKEFVAATEFYKVPSENLMYADREGHIAWVAAGAAPQRTKGDGLFPVPGHTGEYEWAGFRPLSEHPQLYDPMSHAIATANHKILPPNFIKPFAYEWAPMWRFQRVVEMLDEDKRFRVEDFVKMQQDVVSLPAQAFIRILERVSPRLTGRAVEAAATLAKWDGTLAANSREALIYELWVDTLYPQLFGSAVRPSMDILFHELEQKADAGAILSKALETAWVRAELAQGRDSTQWSWGKWHQLRLIHPLGVTEWNLGPVPRPGDANTVNAASGAALQQTNGPSYRQILDLSDWDKSVMTNVPGESGDPASPHYRDLLKDWAEGRYHPMPFSRKAVEAATKQKTMLVPAPR